MISTGTKSLLFGVHQFILHPILVALAWRRVHGCWPQDKAEWVAIMVHDWGYWGCADMDGPEGVKHPARGAALAWDITNRLGGSPTKAYNLVIGHSRSFSPDRLSRLNAPDKVSILFEWKWFYLLRARMTGEIHEFVERARQSGPGVRWANLTPSTWFDWYRAKVKTNFL
jgi:hypothetical protein